MNVSSKINEPCSTENVTYGGQKRHLQCDMETYENICHENVYMNSQKLSVCDESGQCWQKEQKRYLEGIPVKISEDIQFSNNSFSNNCIQCTSMQKDNGHDMDKCNNLHSCCCSDKTDSSANRSECCDFNRVKNFNEQDNNDIVEQLYAKFPTDDCSESDTYQQVYHRLISSPDSTCPSSETAAASSIKNNSQSNEPRKRNVPVYPVQGKRYSRPKRVDKQSRFGESKNAEGTSDGRTSTSSSSDMHSELTKSIARYIGGSMSDSMGTSCALSPEEDILSSSKPSPVEPAYDLVLCSHSNCLDPYTASSAPVRQDRNVMEKLSYTGYSQVDSKSCCSCKCGSGQKLQKKTVIKIDNDTLSSTIYEPFIVPNITALPLPDPVIDIEENIYEFVPGNHPPESRSLNDVVELLRNATARNNDDEFTNVEGTVSTKVGGVDKLKLTSLLIGGTCYSSERDISPTKSEKSFYVSSFDKQEQQRKELPPLPSRNEHFKLYFTTERKKNKGKLTNVRKKLHLTKS